MARIGDRLKRLESNPIHTRRDEEDEKAEWLWRQGLARKREEGGPDEWKVVSQFKILRNKGQITTFEEVLGEIHSRLIAASDAYKHRSDLPDHLKPKPPSEAAVERALALLIYRQEDGALDLVCPAKWRASFEAAEELADRHAKIPVEVMARWIVEQYGASWESHEKLKEAEAKERREQSDDYGITQDLLAAAVGPDLQEIEQEEVDRRISQAIPDYYYGERGVEAAALAARIIEERS